MILVGIPCCMLRICGKCALSCFMNLVNGVFKLLCSIIAIFYQIVEQVFEQGIGDHFFTQFGMKTQCSVCRELRGESD